MILKDLNRFPSSPFFAIAIFRFKDRDKSLNQIWVKISTGTLFNFSKGIFMSYRLGV